MDPIKIQDLLPFLEHPSRYLGSETNRCRKDLSHVQLRMALAFPDFYEIGMSHFGIQILYHILNKDPKVFAERVFAPGEDLVDRLKAAGLPLVTLETQTPLNQMDIVGFSLLYELNYTNVIYMLDLGKIPFFAKERGDKDPLVIAGGPCMCNPEPVAEVFDAIVIGEAEEVIRKLSRAWLDWNAEGDRRRETILKMWSKIEGVYIPSFYKPIYDARGFQELELRSGNGPVSEKIVRRAVVPSLTEAPFPFNPVVPFGKPIHDRLRLEIARGCTRGCRFCQAGILYRPVRERSPDDLLNMAQNSLAATGYDNISLLSLSTGDYTAIGYLMEKLMGRCEDQKVAISLPSVRAGTLTPKLMQLIQRVRKTGFTIAPEAGSQRLRDIVNKNLTDAEIIETVQNAFELGWQVIKLYFMVGLPFEIDADIKALVDLVQKLNSSGVRKKGKGRGTLHVSVATFIPKPHTPFQWAPQIPFEASREKIVCLKRVLNRPGIQFKWQNPEVSLLEGLWARGDRRLSSLLIRAYQKGCCFDAWTDHFKFDQWMASLSEVGIDLDFFTTRTRSFSEPLPWDPFDIGVTRDFLMAEWKKAEKGEPTGDCRKGACQGCGVCDFKIIKPEIFEPIESGNNGFQGEKKLPALNVNAPGQPYRIDYSKQGPARYFGHLEMVKLILQGIRRAGITMVYSQGFHPKPRISFGDPLPVGMESEGEAFDLLVAESISPKGLMDALKRQMPEGIEIKGCQPVSAKAGIHAPPVIRYRIVFKRGVLNEGALEAFQNAERFSWEQPDRKGRLKSYELKSMVHPIKRIASNSLEIQIENRSGKTLRPDTWIRAVFGLSGEVLRGVRIIKLYDGSDDV